MEQFSMEQFSCLTADKRIGIMKQNLRGAYQNVNLLRASFCRGVAGLIFAGLASMTARAEERSSGANEIRILQIQGSAEIMPGGARTWVLTQTNQVLHPGDKLRTGNNSRVTLRWSDQSVVPFGALTEIEVVSPDKSDSLPGLSVVKGILSFFHRDKPGRIRILTRGATASVEGTELVMKVTEENGSERVTLAVIDGKVQLSNAHGKLSLTNNEQGIVEPGQAPTRAPGFIANNLLQWCFYYPGVLDLNDVSLSAEETQALKASLDAYRAGDLLSALANYPASRQPVSDAERIYHAALLLAVGQVEQTETELAMQTDRLAESLRILIAAVKRSPRPSTRSPQLATELLAASYYEQSRATGEESLKAALDLARRAATVSPQFGFAWERVAELEFGFGRADKASQALDKSLELSPRNAQVLALKGFLLAARNKIGEATKWFDRAIATDAALGNAWLARGSVHRQRR
jgi:tetratricopeptide (TPR) repeat protein